MSTDELPARLAVRDLNDLAGLVPYLLGFPPQDSLVVLVMEEGQIALAARADLSASADRQALTGLVSRIFNRFPEADGWFLAFTESAELAWEVLPWCADLVGDRLGRIIHVGADQWCADHPDGPSGALTPSPAADQAAAMGLPLRSCREDLFAQVAGPPDGETDRLLALTEAALAEVGALGQAARRRLVRQLVETASTEQDYVRLAVLAGEAPLQAAVLSRLDLDGAEQAVALWAAVVRHCLVPQLAGPVGLLGLASWLTGDGAMQMVCLERLDQVAPLSPLAAMLEWANVNVLPPSAWPQYRSAMVAAVVEHDRLLASVPRV